MVAKRLASVTDCGLNNYIEDMTENTKDQTTTRIRQRIGLPDTNGHLLTPPPPQADFVKMPRKVSQRQEIVVEPVETNFVNSDVTDGYAATRFAGMSPKPRTEILLASEATSPPQRTRRRGTAELLQGWTTQQK